MRSWGRAALACGAASAAVLGARTAAAGPFEVWGFGPAGLADANARAARATDGTASFYNPGGLALGTGYHLEVGGLYGQSALVAQGRTLSLEEPFGGTLALDGDVPLEGPLDGRLRFGLGTYALPTSLMRLVVHGASDPFYPYYDGRTQRMVVMPALAAKLARGLGVGIGANVLAGVSGPSYVAPGQSRALESRIDEEVTTVVALDAGVRFDPTDRVRLALVYRQRFAVPNRISSVAIVGGVPLDVEVSQAEGLFDPATIVLGASFDATPRLTLEADASYLRWSSWKGPLMDVTATLPGVFIPSPPQKSLWKDTYTVRAAGSYTLPLSSSVDLVVRTGGGYEPTMMKRDQQARTNLLDGDKILLGAGGTLVVRRDEGKALRFSVGGQTQLVSAFSQSKRVCAAEPCPPDTIAGDDATNPSANVRNPGYPTLSGHGAVWAVAASMGVDL